MTTFEQFQQAATKVSSGHLSNLSHNDQLQLYALYSVVNKGPASSKSPSPFLDPRGHAKWSAWSSQSHLTKDQAMQLYIQLVDQLELNPRSTNTTSNEDAFGEKAPKGFDIVDDNSSDTSITADICLFATNGDIDEVQRCIQKQGISPDYRDQDRLTPLMRAVDRNHIDIVDILIAAGADVNAVDEEGQTALHYAVYCDHIDLCGILIGYGASVDIADKEDVKPIDVATDLARKVITEALNGTWERSTPKYQPNHKTSWIPKPFNGLHITAGLTLLLTICLITRFRSQR